jgi:hypothetical protein
MPTWLLLILLSLTAYRATRLVTKDDFPPILWARDLLVGGWRPLTANELQRQADWEAVHADDPRAPRLNYLAYGAQQEINGVRCRYVRRAAWSPYWLSELLGCPWCVSAYISAALTAATASAISVPDPWLVAPAVWAAAALLASREWA